MRRLRSLLVVTTLAIGVLPGPSAVAAGGAPVVVSTSPTIGYSTGGELVRVHGRNLTNVTRVYFGRTAARLIRTEPGGTLVVQTPPHNPVSVYVRVFTRSGSSPATAAARYRWISTVASTSSTTPSRGSTAGGSLVWVRGDSLVHVRGVFFGAVAAQIVDYGTGSAMLVRTPAHPPGPVPVRVRTIRGLTPMARAARYTYAGGPTVTGVAASRDGVYLAGADDVEVAGVNFAPEATVLVDGRPITTERPSSAVLIGQLPADLTTGQHPISVRDQIGTTPAATIQVLAPWRGDRSGPAPVRSKTLVDCVASASCVGVADGTYTLLDGTGWHPDGLLSSPSSLSCVSARDCLAVVGGSRIAHYDGTSWSVAVDAPAHAVSVSCTSNATCVALTSGYETWVRAGTGQWTDTTRTLPSELPLQLSCRTATQCVAAGYATIVDRKYDTRVWFWDGQQWTSSPLPPSDAARVFAACADSFCAAATDDGEVYTSTDRSTWTQRRAWPVSDAMTALDCSADQCVAVDEHGRATVVTALTARRNLVEPVSRAVRGDDYSVSCPADDFCAAGAIDGLYTGPVG